MCLLLTAVFQPKGVLMKSSMAIILDPAMNGVGKFTIQVSSIRKKKKFLFANPLTCQLSLPLDGQQQITINSKIPLENLGSSTYASTFISMTGENKEHTVFS